LNNIKKLSTVNLNILVGEVLADLDTTIKSSDAVIKVSELPILNIYESEVRQLFQNIISNSIKFHKKDVSPEISISSEKINEKWKFAVTDNGIGIAPDYFERVFEIFKCLHTDEKYSGSGIGLAKCRKIVQLHHGEIWIESSPGQGTTIYFTIPILTI
jgi:light-regulated signal transduction histidine kinase (bacteriophytochrome)